MSGRIYPEYPAAVSGLTERFRSAAYAKCVAKETHPTGDFDRKLAQDPRPVRFGDFHETRVVSMPGALEGDTGILPGVQHPTDISHRADVASAVDDQDRDWIADGLA